MVVRPTGTSIATARERAIAPAPRWRGRATASGQPRRYAAQPPPRPYSWPPRRSLRRSSARCTGWRRSGCPARPERTTAPAGSARRYDGALNDEWDTKDASLSTHRSAMERSRRHPASYRHFPTPSGGWWQPRLPRGVAGVLPGDAARKPPQWPMWGAAPLPMLTIASWGLGTGHNVPHAPLAARGGRLLRGTRSAPMRTSRCLTLNSPCTSRRPGFRLVRPRQPSPRLGPPPVARTRSAAVHPPRSSR